MSGGLEVAAGVIAVVQVTGQAAALAFKIKQLWAEVRNAPQEVQDLLDEIELTSLLLQDIERQTEQHGMPVGLASASIMQHTRSAHQALESTADLIDAELKRSQGRVRRTMASSKVLLKKSMLDQLKGKMDRSLKLLQMSLQMQTTMLVTKASSIMVERLPNATSELSSVITSADGNVMADGTANNASEQNRATQFNIMSRRHLQGFDPHQSHQWTWTGRLNYNFSLGDECWVSIQPPSWLARSTSVLITKLALGGPQLALRHYGAVTRWDAQVHDFMRQDDWPGLEMYLRTKRISPYATDPSGFPILSSACLFKSIKILKRLLDIGLEAQAYGDPKAPDWYLYIWQWFIFSGWDDVDGNPLNWELPFEIQRILLSHGLGSILNDFNSLLLALSFVPFTALQRYLDLFMPNTQKFSPQQRLQIACLLLPSRSDNDISVVLPELQDAFPVSEESSWIKGSYLMHHLAMDLACWSVEEILVDPGQRSQRSQRRLQWISRCAHQDPEGPYRVGNTNSLTTSIYRWSLLDKLHVTPLTAFLLVLRKTYINVPNFQSRIVLLQTALQLFLSSLRDGGIDLAALGRNEKQLHSGNITTLDLGESDLPMYPERPLLSTRLRVFGISFGRRVDDWVVWCAWEYEHFAMEFWNMVENPPCHPPGSWVDDKSEWRSEWESFQDYRALNDETSFVWSEVEEGEAGR